MDVGTVIVGVALFVVVAIAVLSIAACFQLWGARIAGIENRTFLKALFVVILSCIAWVPFGVVFTYVVEVREWVNFVAGFLVETVVIMLVFKTSFGKALAASVVAFVLSMVVIGGIALLMVVFVLGGVAFLR